ncbi:LacI family DNA-binding transcriptional regulator [Vibrio superstes]|uniref:Transcriptional regulator n=1 Tax=Vibrio superstes NBRC 103154 TaxID=1219062 RepID=A0A511QYJ9_9VIBR|nr:LacI family DNA-binding transcriptional regulator [Vibrio superstes]GEM81786.1 transcriptional regulator [Vibrio superstes NBRC 103154]
MITIKEVAEFAKVSQATVSRVLNNHSTVKEANKEKVYNAINELGFQPNSIAKALASNRSNSIGVLVGALEGSFFGNLMKEVEKKTRDANLHMIATCGHMDKKVEAESLHFLDSRRVDGLIVHAEKLEDEDLIKLAKHDRPLVVVNRHIEEISEQCFYIDNELGGYLASKHLIELGHRHIGIITGDMNKMDCRERLIGYHRAIQEAGIEPSMDYVYHGTYETESELNKALAKQLLDEHPQVTAVLCQNDNIAMATYDECDRRNLVVGKDISVIGFDDSVYCRYIRPTLTTVNYPIREIGINATNMLLNQLNGSKLPVQKRFNPELVKRNSVHSII